MLDKIKQFVEEIHFSIAPDVVEEIDTLAASLVCFQIVDDGNFAAANECVVKSSKLKKQIEAQGKNLRTPLAKAAKAIKAAADQELEKLSTEIKPLEGLIADYAKRKELERQAALAEKARIEAERAAALAKKRKAEVEAERVSLARDPESPPLATGLVAADLGGASEFAAPPEPAAVVPDKIKTNVFTRKSQKLKIVSVSQIPMFSPSGRRLWTLDRAALTAALKSGEEVPGAYLEEVETTYTRS